MTVGEGATQWYKVVEITTSMYVVRRMCHFRRVSGVACE
ncbi:hypothetical protein L195_g046879 [Trifolium pratense]|uniref:Uncharacterized protein n=1 Tax=Trifolium pratense TaxID=57577 RepID=A0A2K3MIY6_TRIPR|nr:hypothetical protein L195_g046879 [Trifolium pratense]